MLEGKLEDRLAIKDSWEYEERPEEGLLLKEATGAGVKNVARYYHHETVRVGGVIDDVRNNVRKRLNDVSGSTHFNSADLRCPKPPRAQPRPAVQGGAEARVAAEV